MMETPVCKIYMKVVNEADMPTMHCELAQGRDIAKKKRSHNKVDADHDIGAATEELTMEQLMRQRRRK